MKIIVKRIKEEICTYGGRNSDGSYWNSYDKTSIKVYSNANVTLVSVAKEIEKYIKKNASKGNYHHDTGHFFDTYEEEYSEWDSKELVIILNNIVSTFEVGDETCDILLNEQIENVLKNYNNEGHNLHIMKTKSISKITNEITKLTNEIKLLTLEADEIKKKLDAEHALNSYLNNPNQYLINEKILGTEMYLLDCLYKTNNVNLLDEIILKGANLVSDNQQFLIWLCLSNKFEYIDIFAINENLIFNKNKDSIIYRSVIYYAIKYSNLSRIKKHLPDYIDYYSTQLLLNFSLKGIENELGKNTIPLSELALKFSTLDIIIYLCENHEISDFFHIKNSNIYLEECFRDKETTLYFLKQDYSNSISSLMYWRKYSLLDALINEERLSDIELDFSIFDDLKDNFNNNRISYFTYQDLKNNNYRKYNFQVLLEKCLYRNNFDLFNELYQQLQFYNTYVSKNNIVRLLYLITYKQTGHIKANGYVNHFIKLIDPKFYFQLFCVSVIGNNFVLVKTLLPYIDDINAFYDLKLGYCYDLKDIINFDEYSIKLKAKGSDKAKDIGRGTLLHLLVQIYDNNNKIVEMIKLLINAGLDITLRDEEGKVACEYFKHESKYLKYEELADILYVVGTKICDYKGDLYKAYSLSQLPVVLKFKEYIKNGIDAITAYGNEEVEYSILEFYLSCGASEYSLNMLNKNKFQRIIDKSKNISNNRGSKSSSASFYTQKELDDMYRDAFEGDMDATWNID